VAAEEGAGPRWEAVYKAWRATRDQGRQWDFFDLKDMIKLLKEESRWGWDPR
jgi:hypothetical protein